MMSQPKSHGTQHSLSDLPQPGEILAAKYEIEGTLGVGGMAVVLVATHLALRQKVAIKFLLPELSEDPELVERFMREGRASAGIRSEHVVRVFDVDQVDGRPYLVLEHLEGVNLGQLVLAEGPQPTARAVDFVLQACEALAEAHTSGIIHRDLKPDNLFLCHRADGSPCVKVLDFGISKILPSADRDSGLHVGTLRSAVMGTPHYMSPEQVVCAADVDARSDIWSLGAILHELLTAKPPFEGDAITALCARILRDPPPPLTHERPEVPIGLEEIVLRCLQKEPSLRFANVAELAWALAEFGSAAAQASAERTGRVVEGGTASGHPPSPAVAEPHRGRSTPGAQIRALDLVESTPRTPMRRPVAAYVFMALALVGLVGSVGWKVGTQARDIRQAGQKVDAPPAIAQAESLPPVPAPTSVPETTGAVVTNTGAATSQPTPPPPPQRIAPIPAVTPQPPPPTTAPVAPPPTPQVPPAYARNAAAPSRRSVPSPAASFTAPAPKVEERRDDNPFSSLPASPPVPAIPTAAPPQSTPEQLFDGRK